ncbi:MAG: DUF4870 domain-containing protein [Cytophagaceae bacterium]
MIHKKDFEYKPDDNESEKAANSYLMSVIALMVGLPLPIINLIATLIFFLGNRKGPYFVRWHCTQALMSQITVLTMNSVGFYWTLNIIFGDLKLSNQYIAYIITIVLFNLIEFIFTLYTAITTRKGQHVEWSFFGPITNLVCRP